MSERSKAFNSKPDKSHGLAKRIILYRFLQQKFGRALNTPIASSKFNITYFDAFSGAGKYPENCPDEKPNCPFDYTFGSPLLSLYALQDVYINRFKKNKSKTALFIFEELREEQMQSLKTNIQSFIAEQEVYYNDDEWTWFIRKDDSHLKITIKFVLGAFKNFDFETIKRNTPMISFVDPCGFSHTPMDKVLLLMGVKRELLFNFNVESINRFKNVEKQQTNLNELMGTDDWRKYMRETEVSVPAKMQSFMEAYKKCLHNKNDSGMNLKTFTFSMRRGSEQGEDKGYLYYLLFASFDLYGIESIKYAMGVGSQNNKKSINKNEELYFTDYFFTCEDEWLPINLGKEAEGDYIFKHWKSKEVTFGELKEWILVDTPLQVHSNALRELERKHLLQVTDAHYFKYDFSNCVYDERKNRPFPRAVGVNNNDPDYTDELKYRNAWKLSFAENVHQDETPMKKRRKSDREDRTVRRKLF